MNISKEIEFKQISVSSTKYYNKHSILDISRVFAYLYVCIYLIFTS